MTGAQRRITYTLSVIVGLSLLEVTGLTFLVAPMAEDLALSDAAVEVALVTPSMAALLVVFVAGRAGDTFGERRTIITAALVFAVGSGVLAAATTNSLVIVGLASCGAGAIVIQVVALSLLKRVAPDGSAHVRAFTTFGMVFPAAFLILPIATASVLGIANWRWVPVAWAIGGAVVLAMAFLLLDRDRPVGTAGEWGSPILAGVALAAGSRLLLDVGGEEPNPAHVTLMAAVCVMATVACALLLRHAKAPGLPVHPLAGAMMRPLLFGIAVVVLIQILTYVTIALEYFYDMSSLEAALAIAPAQVGAILGAKVLASRAIGVLGVARAGRGLLMGTGLMMLLLIFVQPDTPAWYVVAVSTAFSLTGTAALTVMNLDIMGRAPEGSTGTVSAFRTASSSLGAAASMVVLGAVVLSSVSIAEGPESVGEVQLEELASALRLDGIIGFVIAAIGWVVLFTAGRRHRAGLQAGVSV